MDPVQELLAAMPKEADTVTAWGKVISIDPLVVQFAGDLNTTVISHKSWTYSPAAGETVGLIRFGTRWVAVLKIGAA